MKPKYYSCFFLSLFACHQGNIEVNNEKAQEYRSESNLLDRDSSNIDVVNNFCKGVKDINDKNDPSVCVELTTKLVGKYASSFWSLERCQGIFKQLCKQVPSYPSQIVYNVLYALLKNKCLSAAGVRTIIQGIKKENSMVFYLLNNYVCLNRSRVNETDEPARIIAESFGFIFNDTISIPGINTFTSTPIPLREKAITVNDLTDIWQCVNFIKNNGFDTNSLKKLIKLALRGDFNEAIKAIADAGIFFKDRGDIMMDAFDGAIVNLNDAGLQALANCIQNANKIATTLKVQYLIPSLNNCTNLAPIFNKCENGFIGDNFITLLNDIDLDCTTLLGPLAESLKNGTFNLECLRKLINKYKGQQDTFNKVLAKINNEKFTKNEEGDDVIQAFKNNEIQLVDVNLKNILSMISRTSPISNCEKAICFCDENIKNPDKPNIKVVFDKVGCNFSREDLNNLLMDNSDALNKILPYIPNEKVNKCSKGKNIIQIIETHRKDLNADTIYTVLSMIKHNHKITDTNYFPKIFQWCCEKQDLDITQFISQCENFQFGFGCLKVYNPKYHNQFFAVLDKIESGKFHKHSGNSTLEQIQTLIPKGIYFEEGNLQKILNLCNENKQITNVNALYPVFCRSRKDQQGVNDLINLVKDNSLGGYDFIKKIDDKSSEAKAQQDFVVKFYSKIKDSSIEISDEDFAKKFVWFAYIWYGQDQNLKDLKKKMDKQQQQQKKKKKKMVSLVENALKKETLENFGGKEITNDDFKAFKEKLSEVLDLKKS